MAGEKGTQSVYSTQTLRRQAVTVDRKKANFYSLHKEILWFTPATDTHTPQSKPHYHQLRITWPPSSARAVNFTSCTERRLQEEVEEPLGSFLCRHILYNSRPSLAVQSPGITSTRPTVHDRRTSFIGLTSKRSVNIFASLIWLPERFQEAMMPLPRLDTQAQWPFSRDSQAARMAPWGM